MAAHADPTPCNGHEHDSATDSDDMPTSPPPPPPTSEVQDDTIPPVFIHTPEHPSGSPHAVFPGTPTTPGSIYRAPPRGSENGDLPVTVIPLIEQEYLIIHFPDNTISSVVRTCDKTLNAVLQKLCIARGISMNDHVAGTSLKDSNTDLDLNLKLTEIPVSSVYLIRKDMVKSRRRSMKDKLRHLNVKRTDDCSRSQSSSDDDSSSSNAKNKEPKKSLKKSKSHQEVIHGPDGPPPNSFREWVDHVHDQESSNKKKRRDSKKEKRRKSEKIVRREKKTKNKSNDNSDDQTSSDRKIGKSRKPKSESVTPSTAPSSIDYLAKSHRKSWSEPNGSAGIWDPMVATPQQVAHEHLDDSDDPDVPPSRDPPPPPIEDSGFVDDPALEQPSDQFISAIAASRAK